MAGILVAIKKDKGKEDRVGDLIDGDPLSYPSSP